VYRTPAKVEAVGKDAIKLTHPAIPALKWPGMTMDFKLPADVQRPPGLSPGDQVDAEFRMAPGGDAEITSLTRSAPAAKGKP
jgi:membrane fusion protein, copper/silver efflux system